MKKKGPINEISFTWMKHRFKLNRTGASIYSVDTSVIGVIICCFVAVTFPILIGAFNIAYLLKNKLTSN